MLEAGVDPIDLTGPGEVTFAPHPFSPHIKQLVSVVGVFVLMLGLGITVKLSLRSQNNTISASTSLVDLSLSPNKTTIAPSEQVSLSIGANTHNYKVSAIQLNLQYDSEKFDFISLTKGDFLSKQLDFSTGNGIVKIALGSEPSNPKNGAGILANLVLKAKSGSIGSSIIMVDQSTQISGIDTNGTAVPTSILGVIPQSNIAINFPGPTSRPVLKFFLEKKLKER